MFDSLEDLEAVGCASREKVVGGVRKAYKGGQRCPAKFFTILLPKPWNNTAGKADLYSIGEKSQKS